MKKRFSEAQELLCIHLGELGFRGIVRELQFDSTRLWKADIAIPSCRVLIECDGGMHTGGHKRGAALEDDYLKQNSAQILGWKIFRFSNRQVLTGEAKTLMQKYLTFELGTPQ